MTPEVRAQHTDAVQAAVARAVGVTPESLRLLGGFESFVYATQLRGMPGIVKATWHERRSPEALGAELHFVDYLATSGAAVSRSLPLADGASIATVPSEDGAFHVIAFERAPGALLAREAWNEENLGRWGALAGRMHRLATAYPGPPQPLQRPTWEEEYADVGRLLAHEPPIHAAFERLLGTIRALPREPGTFGAMHTDLHRHNVLWHAGVPSAIDFDDMVDFWFVSDVAIILYYGVMNPIWHADDRQADFDRMRAAVLAGYASEHALPPGCWDTMPLFLALREHTLRAVIQRSMPRAERSPAFQAWFEAATERVLVDGPPLGLAL